jgi:hypothetical protein
MPPLRDLNLLFYDARQKLVSSPPEDTILFDRLFRWMINIVDDESAG